MLYFEGKKNASDVGRTKLDTSSFIIPGNFSPLSISVSEIESYWLACFAYNANEISEPSLQHQAGIHN